MAELSSCDRDHIAYYYLALYRKSLLLTPGLKSSKPTHYETLDRNSSLDHSRKRIPFCQDNLAIRAGPNSKLIKFRNKKELGGWKVSKSLFCYFF